ncbi:hypothetical protein [Roseateles flavus]|uniref:Uncharacterized protein n=1 Tax=Roseateles flavus TaxID=3149041 RepID=A0ABV0G8Y0_9BURK
MSSDLQDYFDALERLKERGEKINNDSVSREAGRKPGSIKKSRPEFDFLRSEIKKAAGKSSPSGDETKRKDALAELREKLAVAEAKIISGYSREISLLRQIRKLRVELVALKGGSVVPLRAKLD